MSSSIYFVHTSPLTWSSASYGSHRAHSSAVDVSPFLLIYHGTAYITKAVLCITTSHHQPELRNQRQASMPYQREVKELIEID